MTGLPPQLPLESTGAPALLKYWRQQMGYSQPDLAAVIGCCGDHIGALERELHPVPTRTLNQVALLYAIQSLPPDAPVSILQDMLTPQSVLDRRAKAQARLAKRQAKRKRQSSKSGRQVPRRSSAGRQRS